MGRILLGALIGAVVIFAWNFVSWVVLPWHNDTISTLPDEAQTTSALKAAIGERGFYAFPMMGPEGPDDEDYKQRHREGPIGHLVIVPEGGAVMPPSKMAISFAGNFLAALLAAMLLHPAASRGLGLPGRFVFVAGLGLFVGVVRDLANWTWWYYPDDFTVVSLADQVVTWALAAIPIALIVRRRKVATEEA